MQENIFDIMEKNASIFADKTFLVDDKNNYTYGQFYDNSRQIASKLCKMSDKKAILVFIKRTIKVPTAMMGILQSGNFYVIIDTESPKNRIEKIIETSKPSAIIYDGESEGVFRELNLNIENSFNYDNMLDGKIDFDALKCVREKMTTSNLAYLLFTSGSTGVPKGVAISYDNITNYISWFIKEFDINSDTIFGSQTPFYFSMSVSDLYASIYMASQYVILPKSFFSFPIMLINFMNQHKCNTIYWVPSAMGIISNLDVLKFAKPKDLTKILFAGEVMPMKYLNYWRQYYPDALFANLFGPTETTDICGFYKVNREFKNNQCLPLGLPCDNCELLVIDENNKLITKSNEQGELLVKSPFVALGYYNNAEKTKESFVQNPLNSAYPDIVYKSGDIVQYNEYGELEYVSRKDFQIKRNGYRIELGEIETNVMAFEGVNAVACVYLANVDELKLFYVGKIDEEELNQKIKGSLLSYMQPNFIKKISSMPYNSNGKIDRQLLKTM